MRTLRHHQASRWVRLPCGVKLMIEQKRKTNRHLHLELRRVMDARTTALLCLSHDRTNAKNAQRRPLATAKGHDARSCHHAAGARHRISQPISLACECNPMRNRVKETFVVQFTSDVCCWQHRYGNVSARAPMRCCSLPIRPLVNTLQGAIGPETRRRPSAHPRTT